MHICIHVEIKYIIYMYVKALHCWFAVGLVLAYSFLIRVGGGGGAAGHQAVLGRMG